MKLKLAMLTFAFAGVILAQDIAGNWQGTLAQPDGSQTRLVLQISKAPEGLKAALFNVDQPSSPRNASVVTFQGSTLKAAFAGNGANYEARLSDDAKSLSGNMVQNATTRPLNFVRATPETAWAIPDAPTVPAAMAAGAKVGIEVATIKASDPLGTGGGIGFDPAGLIRTRNTSVQMLMTTAFAVPARQITGGPGWAATERFDIAAKPDTPGVPTVEQGRAILEKLLFERFALRFHREVKQGSGYALTVGKNGPKLSVNQSGGALPRFQRSDAGAVTISNATMDEVAMYLTTRVLDSPVVDKTGLAGKFDFVLRWRPDPTAAGPALSPEMEERSDVFTALQEQLGLKLEKAQVPVEMLVIDRLEKPSEN